MMVQVGPKSEIPRVEEIGGCLAVLGVGLIHVAEVYRLP